MSVINDEIILSISIPTFNRAAYLKRCLESLFILNNCKDLPVEISVYNNASTDNTDEIVNSFIEKNYPIRYTKIPDAVDGNLNIYQCYKKARGRYVLCLGDDDVFVANTIAGIINYLKHNDIGVLYLSSANVNLNTYKKYFAGNLEIEVNTDSYNFFKKMNFMVTFISTSIISNPQLNEVNSPEKDYLNFYQVPLILQQIFAGKNNATCKNIVLHAEVLNSGSYNLIDVFLVNLNKVIDLVPELNEMQKKYITRVINKELLTGFFPFFLYNIRTKNKYMETSQSLNLLHEFYKKSFYYYIFVYPIYKFPFPLAVIAKKINGGYLILKKKFG